MWLIFLFLYLVDCTSFPESRCKQSDCSYQLPWNSNGSCVIHKTSVCLEILKRSNQMPMKDLDSEDDPKFTFSLVPYIVEYKSDQSSLNRNFSAMNLSFTFHEREIDHFAVKITEDDTSKVICRMFEFKNRSINISLPIDFFYDCFIKLYKFHLEFISPPTQEKLSYYVSIPVAEEIKSICDWRPAITLFRGSLQHGIVRIRFTQAPQFLNVSAYKITFIPVSSVKDKKIFVILSNQEENLLYKEFTSTVDDNCTLKVIPLIDGNYTCLGSEIVFHVGNSKSVLVMMIILYVCIVLFTLGTVVFLKYMCKYIYLLESVLKPQVLLIHSITCPEEKQFVSSFIDYLSNQHGCDVFSIYGSDHDPLEWYTKKFEQCSVIVFIISEGLFLTLEQKHFKHLEVHHPYHKQLQVAGNAFYNQISQTCSDFRKKKKCKICFPFSHKGHIPEWMQKFTGKCYMLPNEISSFLCFIFGCKHGFRCVKQHSSLFNRNVKHSEKYNALINKMEALCDAVKNGLHLKFCDESDTIPCYGDVDESQHSIKHESDSDSSISHDNIASDNSSLIRTIINASPTNNIASIQVQMHPPMCSQVENDASSDSELLNLIEIAKNSEIESYYLMSQMVNESACAEKEFYGHGKENACDAVLSIHDNTEEEFDLCQKPEVSSLLSQA